MMFCRLTADIRLASWAGAITGACPDSHACRHHGKYGYNSGYEKVGFGVFTSLPSELPIFRDAATGTYGIG